MTTTVPFAFTIEQKAFPAGKYNIERSSRRDVPAPRGEGVRNRMVFVTQSVIAKRMLEKERRAAN